MISSVGEIKYSIVGDAIRKILGSDYDGVILITGRPGSGKSTLGVKLLNTINGERFNLREQLMASPDINQIKKSILELPKMTAFLLDEMMEIAYNKKWYSGIQIFLNQFYALNRKENKCSIFIVPKIRRLNKDLRDDRINLWIHVPFRGHAIVYVKNPSPAVKDPWDLDSDYNITGHYATLSNNELLDKLRKSRHYFFDFEFPDLDLETKTVYKELRDKDKYKTLFSQDSNVLGKREIKSLTYMVTFVTYIKKMNKWTNEQLADWMTEASGIETKVGILENWSSQFNIKKQEGLISCTN